MFQNKKNEFRIPFDPIQVDNLFHYLKSDARNGIKRYYSITVDNIPVVTKTNNIGFFNQYQRFIHQGTREIIFCIYSASDKSPAHRKHIFFMPGDNPNSEAGSVFSGPSGLNGLDIEQLVDQRLGKEIERMEKEQLTKELDHNKQKSKEDLEQAKKQLDEAEEYALELADKLEEVNLLWKESREELAKVKQSKTYDLISGLAGVIPSIIPEAGPFVSGALSGMSGDRKEQTPQTEASFSKKKEETTIDEKTREQLEFLDHLERAFNQNERILIMDILNRFIDSPDQLTTVAELLGFPINK